MVRKSILTRSFTPMQRAEFHKQYQGSRGHWLPDPVVAPPRPGYSYRAARRNILRKAGLLGRASA